jgi:hypothetical protein
MEIGKCGLTEREIRNPKTEYPSPNLAKPEPNRAL